MNTFLQDLRVAARQLAGHPSFTLIVVVTLALSIGAMTTCFAVLNAVAFRPLPFTDPDRLVALHAVDRRGGGWSRLSLGAFAALQDTQGVFSGSVAYDARAVTVTGAGVAERVQAAAVSSDVFSLLGVPVHMGRPLAAADAGTRVVVIGHDLWLNGLGSNPDVVGTTLSLDGDTHVVVGVATRGFSFPEDSRLWLPIDTASPDRPVDVVARLEPGVSGAQADATLATAPAGTFGPGDADHTAAATTSLRSRMIGTKQRDMALFVLTAAGLVLLVACANLAGILTAYVGARKHEMAVRAAIGAGRRRLVRQLMTESAVLALAGGMIGLLLAQWGIDLFAATLGKPQGADWIEFAVDGRVVIFAVAASAVTALSFGLAPALRASRVDLRSVLQQDGRTSGSGPRARRVRGLLVAGQVALSLALVSGAAALVTSSMRFDDIDVGFERDGILALRVALAGRAYEQAEQRFAFVDAATARLRSLPGVSAVAAASHLPLIDRNVEYAGFVLDGSSVTGRPPFGSVRFVDAGYIAAMGIPIRRGRAFAATEARAQRGDRAIVINDTMARRYWPDRDPIGTTLRLTGDAHVEGSYRVIGVAGDVTQRQLPAAPENQMYLPLAPARELTLMVRAASDPATVASRARDAVHGIDRWLAISTNTMSAVHGWYVRDRRLQGLVIGSLGLIAMLLAGLGVYGVMSLLVNERSREIAIRIALGSSANAVLRLVLTRGLGLATAGVGVGVLLASALTAFLSSTFMGVRAFDWSVLCAAAALLGLVAGLASWWPARRAMRVDPMVTLKE